MLKPRRTHSLLADWLCSKLRGVTDWALSRLMLGAADMIRRVESESPTGRSLHMYIWPRLEEEKGRMHCDCMLLHRDGMMRINLHLVLGRVATQVPNQSASVYMNSRCCAAACCG